MLLAQDHPSLAEPLWDTKGFVALTSMFNALQILITERQKKLGEYQQNHTLQRNDVQTYSDSMNHIDAVYVCFFLNRKFCLKLPRSGTIFAVFKTVRVLLPGARKLEGQSNKVNCFLGEPYDCTESRGCEANGANWANDDLLMFWEKPSERSCFTRYVNLCDPTSLTSALCNFGIVLQCNLSIPVAFSGCNSWTAADLLWWFFMPSVVGTGRQRHNENGE